MNALRAVRRPIADNDSYALLRDYRAAIQKLCDLAERRHLTGEHPWGLWTSCEHPVCQAAFRELASGPFGLEDGELLVITTQLSDRVRRDVTTAPPPDADELVRQQQELLVQEWEARRALKAAEARTRKPPSTTGINGSRFL